MYKTFFRKLSEEENGTFKYHNKDVSIGFGVRSPNLIYKVTFDYKENEFTIVNQTGTNYVGYINCKISKHINTVPFRIEYISHFKSLFLKNKNRLRVITDNKNLAHFINTNESFQLLNEISKKDDYSPLINIEKYNHDYLMAKYHLEFNDWMEPVKPTIKLFKDIIDEFEKNTLNISYHNYLDLNSN